MTEAYLLVQPARMRDWGWTVPAEADEVSLDERMVARAALRRGCEALGLDASEISIRWFHCVTIDTPGAMRTKSGEAVLGQFNPAVPQRIEIRTGQPLADIRRAVFHELRHLAQHRGLIDGPADLGWRESDASAWADTMMSTERPATSVR
jgi:hypothetical protein